MSTPPANEIRESFDLVIAGGGPAGIVAAVRAKELGLATLLIEADELMATIRDYPSGTNVLSGFSGGENIPFPAAGPLVESFGFDAMDKDRMVELWRSRCLEYGVASVTGSELVGIEEHAPGGLRIRTRDRRTDEERDYVAPYVIVAIGAGNFGHGEGVAAGRSGGDMAACKRVSAISPRIKVVDVHGASLLLVNRDSEVFPRVFVIGDARGPKYVRCTAFDDATTYEVVTEQRNIKAAMVEGVKAVETIASIGDMILPKAGPPPAPKSYAEPSRAIPPVGKGSVDCDYTMMGRLRVTPPGPVTRPLLDEDVQFTIYRPRRIAPSRWYTVLAFAHLAERRPDAPALAPHPAQVVAADALRVLGPQAATFANTTQESRQPIPNRGVLTFALELPGMTVNPTRRSFEWLEDVHREEFRVMADSRLEGHTVRGSMTVYLAVSSSPR